MTVGFILGVIALLLAIASFLVTEYPLLAVAVILLAVAHVAGDRTL